LLKIILFVVFINIPLINLVILQFFIIILEEFEKRAKKEGCHRCFLETSKKHREALKFYKKEKKV